MNHKRMTSWLLAAGVMVSLAGCGSQTPVQEEPESAGTAVQVETVNADTISAENRVSGKIAAENEETIMVATSAKCTAVYAQAGDMVQAGDVLCTLDLGSALASRNAAQISYDAAVQSYQDQKTVLDSQVSLYSKTLEDLKALYEIGAASQLEIDQAQLQLS